VRLVGVDQNCEFLDVVPVTGVESFFGVEFSVRPFRHPVSVSNRSLFYGKYRWVSVRHDLGVVKRARTDSGAPVSLSPLRRIAS
jgi:hypothetical protein